MGLLEQIDLDAIRLPLAGDAPAGANLDEQGEARTRWRKVVDAFREARSLERKAEQPAVGDDKPPKLADSLPLWRTIGQESLAILAGVSRDLRVAQYLIMTLVRTDGFAGLAAGCRVARTLVDAQWSMLGPVPEPDEPDVTPEEMRVQPLVELAGGEQAPVLEDPILHVTLLAGCPWGRFGMAHLPGGVPLDIVAEDFRGAKSATTLDFFVALHSSVAEAQAEWEALADAVHAAAEGRVSLPRSKVCDLLGKCRMVIQELAGGRIPDGQPPGSPVADAAKNSSDTDPGTPGRRGGLAGHPSTRDDALRALEQVANFFEQQDPHSLLSAQIRYVVRMARMKQVDYFRELIRDKPALEQLSRFVGLDFGGSEGDAADA